MKRKNRKSPSKRTPHQTVLAGDAVTGNHDPKMFASLKHFFKMDEATNGATRTDAVDYISAMTMDLLFQAKTGANLGDVAIDYGVVSPSLVASGYNDNSQPDHGGSTPPLTASSAFTNLGSDDWLFFAAGHNLTTGASGTNMFLGDIITPASYIGMAGGTYIGGDYSGDPITLVRDTNGNTVDFPSCADLSGNRRAGVAGAVRFGQKEPFMWSLYRKGNIITRRVVALLTGEVRTDSIDCTNLTGDVHPSAHWFWSDFITYGHGLFHFTQGTPDRIDEYCDWMADQWRNNPLAKQIHPNLLVHI